MSFKDYLPSQIFRKRLLAVVIIIVIVLAIIFGVKLIGKGIKEIKIRKQIKNLPIELQAEARTMTLGELQTKDSNGNAIPDWEERLFGLDPSGNGEENKQIILSKKAQLRIENGITEDEDNTNPKTETEKFAKDFISLVMSLEGSNALTDDALNNISNAAGDSLSDYNLPDVLSSWDVKTVDNSVVSRDKYVNALLSELVKITDSNGNDELTIISGAIENEKDAEIIISPIIKTYKQSTEELKTVFVPKTFLNQHLAIVNSLSHIATALENMKYVSTDPARATKGIMQYQVYSETLDNAIQEIQAKY